MDSIWGIRIYILHYNLHSSLSKLNGDETSSSKHIDFKIKDRIVTTFIKFSKTVNRVANVRYTPEEKISRSVTGFFCPNFRVE